MAKEIPLTRGLAAIVDDEDYEWLSQWKWRADAYGYGIRDSVSPQSKSTVKMHRELLAAPRGTQVDHINGNRLDNRRTNLRLCSNTENRRNLTQLRQGKSGKYKGVCWFRRDGNWRAQIKLDRESIHIGYFDTELEAARAYDAKAIELFGEFACTNEMLGLYEKEPQHNPGRHLRSCWGIV